MAKYPLLKILFFFVLLIVLVTSLSLISNRLWGSKPEVPPAIEDLIIEKEMTIIQFGQANELPNSVLREIFGLEKKSDLEKRLDEYGTIDQVASMVIKELALASEHAGKNWIKIIIKFVLWLIFLTTIFILFKKRKITSGLRKWLLFSAGMIFGVIMGSDPSPMGTVKDAIHLYATARAVFPARMIAMLVFLAIVFIANKYICAWGCQVGTMQDLIFRINQTDKRKAVIGRQIKLPFALTNTIRFICLCVFSLIAFLWGIDIIEPVDPFKIYNPAHLGLIGGAFVIIILLISLFFYRPWCHFFCPFGLVGWLVEKISLVRISVNYETCIACQKCARACPSTVMAAILKRDKKTIPDCFACYTCREACPTDSISFSTRRRTIPPAGHFDKKKKEENL